MGKIILITGGTRSGKSSFGESLLKDKDEVLYIATAKVLDEEMLARVKKHRESRNEKWETYEGYKNLKQAITNSETHYVLFECVGTMVTNFIFDKYQDFDNLKDEEIKILELDIIRELYELINEALRKNRQLILITNEVGFSLVSEHKLGRIFTDILGRVNQELGKISDEVYLVACGIPLRLK